MPDTRCPCSPSSPSQRILDNLDTLGANITKLRDQLAPLGTQEFWKSLLSEDMNKDLELVKERVTYYLQQLPQLREELGSKVRDSASKSVEKLRKLLERYSDQMPPDVASRLQALLDGHMNLAALREQAGEKLRELQKKMGEKLSELKGKLQEKLSQLSANTEPVAVLLEDLRSGMQPLWDSFLLLDEGTGQ